MKAAPRVHFNNKIQNEKKSRMEHGKRGEYVGTANMSYSHCSVYYDHSFKKEITASVVGQG